ncbi:MAG: hypothetical protein JXK16_02955 [Thiotrichales bacterium]|nr:hypothetical protein [Thiotrichales bacterium]
MSNPSILSIIQEIRSDAGKIFKEKTIAKYKDNPLFLKILSATYDPRIKFGIKNIPEYIPANEPTIELHQAVEGLDPLSSRELTGNAAQNHLAGLLIGLSVDNAEVLKLVIGQSLEIGCGASTINKAIGKNFIKDTPYMGCSPFSLEKFKNLLNDGCIIFSQTKMDGRYQNLRVLDGQVIAESRQGLQTDFGAVFDAFTVFQDLNDGEPLVLNGELLIKGISRYESNGIISSLVSIGDAISLGENAQTERAKLLKKHGDTYENFLAKLSYVVWDYIPNHIYIGADTWNVPYASRMRKLVDMVEKSGVSNVEVVDSRVISSIQDAMAHYKEIVASGGEGTVVKADKAWKNGKASHNLKFKSELSLDLRVVSANLGTGKNSGLISSLNVETECGLLKTSPAGINVETMLLLTEMGDELIGRLVEIKCNGLSKDRDGNNSVLHPVFVRLRDDKAVADTFEKCQEIEESAKGVA